MTCPRAVPLRSYSAPEQPDHYEAGQRVAFWPSAIGGLNTSLSSRARAYRIFHHGSRFSRSALLCLRLNPRPRLLAAKVTLGHLSLPSGNVASLLLSG